MTASPNLQKLANLLFLKSKHSQYQELYGNLGELLGVGKPDGKRESSRWRFMSSKLNYNGMKVLDIGANTGFFSFAAQHAGAVSVVSLEGNPDHSEFIELAAKCLGIDNAIKVSSCYYGFDDTSEQVFDIVFCLNVLHHIGDDFGDPALDIESAKHQILVKMQRMARLSRHMWFQLGFNWKGDPKSPLFPNGNKSELIDFIRQGVETHWKIDQIAVCNPLTYEYEPIDCINIQRFDPLGEFLNRPLFLMSSLKM